MDGIHDLGGMHGFGPVIREDHEPPFHFTWEATVRAMQNATRTRGIANIDEFRHAVERMEPGHYLVSTYYEHWLDGLERILVEKNIVSESEIDQRQTFFTDDPNRPATDAITAPLPERWPPAPRIEGPAYQRPETRPPLFKIGDPIVTRNTHPTGHTRLPKYVRGKRGVIHAYHGVFVFPDSHAHGKGENPQPMYSVKFEGTELWGDSTEPREAVYIDLWEPYLLRP